MAQWIERAADARLSTHPRRPARAVSPGEPVELSVAGEAA
jgi:hypothetical protein